VQIREDENGGKDLQQHEEDRDDEIGKPPPFPIGCMETDDPGERPNGQAQEDCKHNDKVGRLVVKRIHSEERNSDDDLGGLASAPVGSGSVPK
jgi:hypothetical protein